MITNKNKFSTNIIVYNKKIKYNYIIEQEFEAGISLYGWEVKALRAGKISIYNSYIVLKEGEAYLLGANFQPISTLSKFLSYDSMRNRKLLLKKKELIVLLNSINKHGYTIIPISIYWQKNWIKINIGMAKGKKEHDKRDYIKKHEWSIYKNRIVKQKIIKNIN